MSHFAKKLGMAERGKKTVVVYALEDGRFSTIPRWKKERAGEKIYTRAELIEMELEGCKVILLEVNDWRK